MATKIYLRVLDEDQAPLEMKPPWVMPRDSVEVIAELHGEGNDVWSLELNPEITGDVQLVLRIADHPPLPFSMQAEDGAESPFGFRGSTPRCASLTRQVVTRGGDQSTTIVALQFNLARKHEEVIMVAGADLHGDKVTYRLFAETLRDDLYAGTTYISGSRQSIPRAIHDHTVVTFFDFATGHRCRQMKAQRRWHDLDEVLLGAKAPYIECPDNGERQDRRRDEDTISILHVYDYIASLGRDVPRSLQQLHFFSHSWVEGPILLDTNERTEYKSSNCTGIRDPGDKDPRCKDFCEEAIRDFQGFCEAFAIKGFAKVWGCLRHAVHDYVEAVADLKDPDEMRPAGNRGIPYSSREVAEMVRREAIPRSYLGNLIAKSGVEGMGAVPTTTSNYKHIGSRHYMFVDRDHHGKHLGWFERNFGVKADEWGYVDFRALL
jgi:hypothetical protein